MQLRLYSEQQRAFRISNISYSEWRVQSTPFKNIFNIIGVKI